MLNIQSHDNRNSGNINRILREMIHYFHDAEKDSDDIYVHVFPEIVLKTIRSKCLRAVNELYSWIDDDDFHVLTPFHQYVLYWIIEFCLREEEAYNEAVIELGMKGDNPGLFGYTKHYLQERGEAIEPFLSCFPDFDPTDINIMLLQGMFAADTRLNKAIIDQASKAVVPVKSAAAEPVEMFEVENDYVWFCFTKFTKTSIAIQKIIKMSLYEDALILTRSNYESLIHAKAVMVSPGAIDHLVEYKLGLENGTYNYVRRAKAPPGYRIIAYSTDPEMKFPYTFAIREIAALAEESYSYDKIYRYLCDMTHCDIKTIGYYQEDGHYSYKGSSREALMNSLLWNVYFNWKFYQAFLNGDMLDIDILFNKMADTFIEHSSILKEIFDSEILKSEVYMKSVDDDVLRGRIKAYVADLNALKEDVCLTRLVENLSPDKTGE